jgi:hypothetical protein
MMHTTFLTEISILLRSYSAIGADPNGMDRSRMVENSLAQTGQLKQQRQQEAV